MKGIVYFIKQVGLTPIKIGKSSKDAFKNRVSSLKISAPYGIEIIGIIECEDAIKLEGALHKRFKDYRLNGEWFEISVELADSIIIQHKNKKLIEAKNKFILDYYRIFEEGQKDMDIIEDLEKNHKGEVLRQRDIIEMYLPKSNVQSIKNQLKMAGYKIKAYSYKGKTRQGYKIP